MFPLNFRKEALKFPLFPLTRGRKKGTIIVSFLYTRIYERYPSYRCRMKQQSRMQTQKNRKKHLSKHNKTEAQPSQPSLPIIEAPPEEGLSREAVRERMEKGLVNTPVASPVKSEKQIVRDNCLTFFNLIFLILAICLALVGSFEDMLFLGIAITNTAIGIFQEIRSKRTIDKMTLVASKKLGVVRCGKITQIPSELLVRDDIVEFAHGDQICADGVICTGQVQVNESLITGEADAIVKNPGDPLLSGSFVIAGRCKCRLTKVGAESYVSKLTLEAKKDAGPGDSEMMRALTKLIRVIGIALVPMGIVLFCKQYYILEVDLKAAVESTVAALIGMIPEGLYLLTSVALALSVMRLARRKVLVQDMSCIETLARVDVLCADKTGTITEETMEALDPVLCRGQTDERVRMVLNAFYDGADVENDTARAMVAKYYKNPSKWNCKRRIPFTSATKWSGAVFVGEGSYVIGAPEFILQNRIGEVAEMVNDWAARGYRVVLLAEYDGTPAQTEGLDPSLVTPMAIVPLSNRIRPEAKETFRYFAAQGVTVKVISGDNPRTVSEVAGQAGIERAASWIDAGTLSTDEDYDKAVEKYTVFGRVTPEQKRKLIRTLQKKGHTVAMTGDGVNDVLALKVADCGIAMASGSDAACQAAQLVLLENNFRTMPAVVAEGRRVINNIERAASLFLVKNIFSFLLTFVLLFVNLPYPLVPLHLSMISALTIGFPSFVLALEPNKNRVRGKFMRNVLRAALPGGVTNLCIVLLLQAFVAVFDFPMEQLYTMTAVVLSFVGILVLIQVSHPIDWKRDLLCGAMTVAIVFCFTVLHTVFDFVPLSTQSGLVLAVLLLLTIFIMLSVLRIQQSLRHVIRTIRVWWKKKRDSMDAIDF